MVFSRFWHGSSKKSTTCVNISPTRPQHDWNQYFDRVTMSLWLIVFLMTSYTNSITITYTTIFRRCYTNFDVLRWYTINWILCTHIHWHTVWSSMNNLIFTSDKSIWQNALIFEIPFKTTNFKHQKIFHWFLRCGPFPSSSFPSMKILMRNSMRRSMRISTSMRIPRHNQDIRFI